MIDGGFDSGFDSVDIGGYWGGWEGGVVVEPGWGSVPLGEGISYGGGYGGSISSDLGFDFGRETSGLGHGDWQTQPTVCVQGGVPPDCPQGYEVIWNPVRCRWECVPVARVCIQGGAPRDCPEGYEAVWDNERCAWVCKQPTPRWGVTVPPGVTGSSKVCQITYPAPKCPEGMVPGFNIPACSWECRPASSVGNGSVSTPGGGAGGGGGGGGTGASEAAKGPLDRVADVIDRVLAGGGGGIIIPQIPQPQAVVAPTTERRYNPAAIVLLVAGLALGGYYVYQRTRRS
jgi:hypothetical protein